MTTTTNCLECGAEIPTEARGLCPKCLLKLGLASQLGDSSLPASPGNASPPPLMPFEFGGYRILRLLGKGGMGAVYEAEELVSGRRVALKVLGHSLDSADTRKRFIREGRLAASINHPNSVYVYGTEEIDGAPVITMELVPGGTLHERVKSGGPMPIAEAVDAILQVIAGLEAAHAAGILHRDIKPSNCFLEPGGAVKIGDFGLSISTLSRGDSALTVAGSILGTPDFSSPEQLRGEALDVRSDIYSIGVTLYYLLTGRAPFQAENMVALLATVLDKPAPSPRTFRPEIPEALARVILRCLAKPAGDRFKDYDDLRHALLPFGSTAPRPATLGLRFAAACLDQAAISVLGMLFPALIMQDALAWANIAALPMTQRVIIALGMFALELAYFAIPEGRWGATAGKALVGLRVTRLDRSVPGLPRALGRAAICLLPGALGLLRYLGDFPILQSRTSNNVFELAHGLFVLALFSTARRRNGFAAVHDLLTGTRVIEQAAHQPRTTFTPADEPMAAVESQPQFGPYHVLAPMGDWLLGYDAKLLRRVWIRPVAADTPPVAAALRNAARPGRLRWLQGQRTDAAAWDAYEAVPGAPLVELLRTPQPWKTVRFWLHDLALEFAAAARDGSLPAVLAIDRVWITSAGRAKLLDFPAPGGEQGSEPVSEPSVFLNQVALSALEGRVAFAEDAHTREPRVPAPLPARDFFRERRTLDPAALSARLEALVQQLPAVSRRRRLGLIAGCVLPALAFGVMGYSGMTLLNRWQSHAPELLPLLLCLTMHDQLVSGQLSETQDLDPAAARPALEVYIAGNFGGFIRDPGKWDSDFAKVIPALQRAAAERIVAAHPAPTAEELAAATTLLKPLIEGGDLDFKYFSEAVNKLTFIIGGGVLPLTALLSLVCAAAFRGGLLLRVVGVAAVTRDGSDASRGRMLWRACVAWSWLPLTAVLVAMLAPVMSVNTAAWLIANILLGIVAWSALTPGRSLPDRLAGTWLVPR